MREGARARRLPGAAVLTDARLALVCLTSAPIVVYPLVRLGQKVRRTTKRSQEHLETLSHVASEAFAGHRIVKAFGTEAQEASRFARASDALYRTNMKVTSALSSLPPVMEFLGGIAMAGGALVRQPRDRAGPADDGRLRARSSRRCSCRTGRPRSSAASTPTCSRRLPPPAASSRCSTRTPR